jgi:hypothetical protein
MSQFEASINLPPDPQIAPRLKKVRGRNKATIKLVEAMREIAEKLKPITGRGIGYQLFTRKLIDSMKLMPKVYRALVNAHRDGIIPYESIVDETRGLEQVSVWKNGAVFAGTFFYRRDLWQTQEKTVEVWSEKGTVRGVLWSVLAEYGVGFRVMHGFTSETCVWDVSTHDYNDDRPLVALYIGDYDPSGMYMSERDLPERIAEHQGYHIEFKRIAITKERAEPLPSFSVETKSKDKRYKWFKSNFGGQCWELDAMDPNQLRDLVRAEIKALIDPVLWAEQEALQARDKQSIDLHMKFLQQQDERKKQAAEIQLRQLALFQRLAA